MGKKKSSWAIFSFVCFFTVGQGKLLLITLLMYPLNQFAEDDLKNQKPNNPAILSVCVSMCAIDYHLRSAHFQINIAIPAIIQ